jgi:F-box domain
MVDQFLLPYHLADQNPFLTVTTMPSIPIDVLREILEHVHYDDLPTLCRVNKICCSCSQDVLYRGIGDGNEHVIQTLAQSTDLARRVRWFATYCECPGPELAIALRNMSSLRSLHLNGIRDASTLDGCTFKLDSFSCSLPYSESLQQFLNSQPSITEITFDEDYDSFLPFDENCLPNLTRVMAVPSWLGKLIPGRPVREVYMSYTDSTDWSFSTLSTTPIQKLKVYFDVLYSKPVSFMVSTFPSLVHLRVITWNVEWVVHVRLCLSI